MTRFFRALFWRNNPKVGMLFGILLGVIFTIHAEETAIPADTIWHVAPNGDNTADGMSWATAKQSIQAAIRQVGI